MGSRLGARIGALLGLCLVLGACSTAPSPSATQPGPSATSSVATLPPSEAPTPVPIGPGSGSSIQEALAFVPPGSVAVSFTDWAQLKAEAGYADVTSSSPKDEHDALLAAIGSVMTTNPPSPRTSMISGWRDATAQWGLAAQWGFDATDLGWELVASVDRLADVIVLRFPDSFDLQPLIDLLVERSYAVDEVDGARVYSHDPTPDEWLISEPEFQNVAFLEDGRTIVLARLRPETGGLGTIVESILDPSATSVLRAQFATVAAALDHPTAASLFLGDALCELHTSYAPSDSDQVKEEIAAAQPLGRYAAWGIGYTDARDPVGRMVFSYATSGEAAADLPGRRRLMERGHVSMQNPPRTFAEARFTVVDARADGPRLILELQPFSDAPGGMLAIPHALMSYATCGDPFGP